MKKVFLLVLLVCLLPVVSLAAEIVERGTCGAQGDNLTWTLDSDGVLTISGTGEMANYAWKDNVKVRKLVIGSGVTSIGEAAFRNCPLLTSVTFADDLEIIKSQAFYCCFNLSEITFGSGVKEIGTNAFDQCGFTALTIPDSVETIGDEAFLGCIRLSNLKIGSNVKSLPSFVFASCRELTSVTIPDSVESIDDCAFSSCEKLTSVAIGSGVKEIAQGVFSDCTVLSDILYLGSQSGWDNIDIHSGWDDGTPDSKRFHCIAASGTGTDGNPYIITDADHWDTLVKVVNDGALKTAGKHFKLGRNISVTSMLGTSDHPFSGTFDGNGMTLTFTAENTDLNVRTAPFAYVKNAEIKNLCTAGRITGSSDRASGLIGENYGTSTVTNCRSSMSISGGAFIGGFCIGAGDSLSITGCVFDGTIMATKQSGGFVGWGTNGLSITDCLFAPKEGSSVSGGTFYYRGGGDGTLTNTYYLTLLGNAQGKQARAVMPGEDVSIGFGKEKAQYRVSGITAYPVGLTYGNAFYASGSENATLLLSAQIPEGKLLKGFAPDAGTLTHSGNVWTLTMPDEDVEISAVYDKIVYVVDAAADPAEGGTVSGAGPYEHGSEVTLTAAAGKGYRFTGWTEGGNELGTDATITFTATANRTLTADFIPVYTVSAAPGPAAGGTVTGTGTYDANVEVALTASANTGYRFVNWTEGDNDLGTDTTITFKAAADRILTANFIAVYTVTVTADPEEWGTVTGAGTYDANASVTVTAAPKEGCVFAGWTENGKEVGRDAEYTFTAEKERKLTANFAPVFVKGNLVLPKNLKAIEPSAFEGTAMETVEIPPTCTSIGDYAFRNSQLTQIRIPADCTLGEDVFDGCGKVYVYGEKDSPADTYCRTHGNCLFVKE